MDQTKSTCAGCGRQPSKSEVFVKRNRPYCAGCTLKLAEDVLDRDTKRVDYEARLSGLRELEALLKQKQELGQRIAQLLLKLNIVSGESVSLAIHVLLDALNRARETGSDLDTLVYAFIDDVDKSRNHLPQVQADIDYIGHRLAAVVEREDGPGH